MTTGVLAGCSQQTPPPESQAELPEATEPGEEERAPGGPAATGPGSTPPGEATKDAPAATSPAAAPNEGDPSASHAVTGPPPAKAPAPAPDDDAPAAAPATGDDAPGAGAPEPKAAGEPRATPAPRPAPAPAPKKPSGYGGDDPCTRTQFATGQVRAACLSGGRPAVKALMKNVVKSAKAAGESLKCSSCHSSMKSYELRPNAVSELRKWL